ncbi:hypothetical protein B0T10DRAFT_488712 [Thelonectria olida]|uniref:Secreted protein n=1 Tax=Thelonectria olida TaxID=1576542 RepID=A0A9P8W3U2_9HYPO|nr:hypothetical protein B0T10DRAFT_488712 [Thelonectria olida]
MIRCGWGTFTSLSASTFLLDWLLVMLSRSDNCGPLTTMSTVIQVLPCYLQTMFFHNLLSRTASIGKIVSSADIQQQTSFTFRKSATRPWTINTRTRYRGH